MATIKKACKGALYPKSSSVSKRLGSPSKAKNGKSFPVVSYRRSDISILGYPPAKNSRL